MSSSERYQPKLANVFHIDLISYLAHVFLTYYLNTHDEKVITRIEREGEKRKEGKDRE